MIFSFSSLPGIPGVRYEAEIPNCHDVTYLTPSGGDNNIVFRKGYHNGLKKRWSSKEVRANNKNDKRKVHLLMILWKLQFVIY